MNTQISFRPYGAHAILVEWKPEINSDILFDLLRFKKHLEQEKSKRIAEMRSAYNSLLVIYKEAFFSFENEVKWMRLVYGNQKTFQRGKSKLWKIPVCYDDAFGLDLALMAKAKGISKEDLIKRHTSRAYRVYFIGFLPGFLYLGGLDESLFMPRKDTPRFKIERGSVAIGGQQTGIYPNESPGGWNIIGNSPISFFNVDINPPCFAKAGGLIQFYPIDLKEHEKIKLLEEANIYNLESEDVND